MFRMDSEQSAAFERAKSGQATPTDAATLAAYIERCRAEHDRCMRDMDDQIRGGYRPAPLNAAPA